MTDSKNPILVLLRHGQSEWNKRNLFTGWVDVSLSSKGVEEAIQAGKVIAHIPFDVIYTSTLIRAQMTAMLAMSTHDEGKVPCFVHEDETFKKMSKIHDPGSKADTIPVYMASELNERMYGKLQGLNKEKTKQEFGEEQFIKWRRGYDTPPPEGESLKMTKERSLPYFEKKILPHLERGENVLISAHGNSLRALIMEIESVSEQDIVKREIPTGDPLGYEYKDGKFIIKKFN